MYKTILTGNLGADATLGQHEGKQVINFNVAVQLGKDRSQWLDCSYWRKAEQSTAIIDYLKKGQKVLVEGQITADVWDGKAKLRLMVGAVELL